MEIKEVSKAIGLSEYTLKIGIRNKVFPFFRLGDFNSPHLVDYDEFIKSIKYLEIKRAPQKEGHVKKEINQNTDKHFVNRF